MRRWIFLIAVALGGCSGAAFTGFQLAERAAEARTEHARTPDDMVYVPEGVFTMGVLVGEGAEDSSPAHSVYLDAYFIDLTEVTNQAYEACVKAGGCSPIQLDACHIWSGGWKKGGPLDPPMAAADHPVVCVTWHQASGYCEWRERRLPTEAEWEKAARGDDGRRNPWGAEDATCEFAVKMESGAGCGTGSTLSAGSKPEGASPYGALDLVGSVWEWTHDYYSDDHYRERVKDLLEVRNPKGPELGSERVRRGGAFSIQNPSYLTASFRGSDPEDQVSGIMGFRCAKSAR